MRRAIHLWADEETVPKLHTTLKEKCLNGLLEPYKTKSFKVDVDLFCNSQTLEEKIQRIEVIFYTFLFSFKLLIYCPISLSVICRFKDLLILKIQTLHFSLLSTMV